jgi:heptosyltransferase-3
MVEQKDKIAIIGEFGLGDTLIQMVMARNIMNAGYEVTLFSNILRQLAAWFPLHTIRPGVSADFLNAELAPFSKILASGGPPTAISSQLKSKWISYESGFSNRVTMVQNIANFTKGFFNISSPTTETGIQAPSSLRWRQHVKRVVIHPTSAEDSKNWPVEKFTKLAQQLAQRQFDVVFIMSEAELDAWAPKIDSRFSTIGFRTLDRCAAYIYESGFFVGNDSGGGHLAACLHIPTLSIHGRKGKSKVWRPDWGTVEVISPAFNLVGRRLRQACWKHFLPVGRVQRAFEKLTRRSAGMQ